MKMGKRVLTVLLASCLVVSLLSACQSNGNKQSGQKEEVKTSANPDSSVKEPVELNLFVNASWWPLKDWSGSIPEEITKRTGVKLKITVATDEKQLPLMIASGDLPDLVFSDVELDRLSTPEISYSWNELIDKYAPDFKIDPIRQVINKSPDGNFYTVLSDFSTPEEWKANPKAINGGPAFHYRKDIMEQLGNPPLKSMNDLLNVFTKVKQARPDMVPLMLDKNWISQYFAMQFGAKLPGQKTTDFVEKDGKLNYYLTQPETLDYYKFMNKLYREGFITSDNFAFNDDKKDDDFLLNDKAFSTLYAATYGDVTNTQLEKSGKSYKFSTLADMLSDKAAIFNDQLGWSGMYVSKKNKNPEAAIKFIQFMFSDKGQKLGLWGIEGKDWTMSAEGYPIFKYNRNDTDLVAKEGYTWWGLLANSGVINGLGYYDPKLQSTPANLNIMKVMKFNPILGLVKPGADSDQKVIQTKLADMISNEELKIILAKSEDEAVQAYKNLLKKAEEIGMKKYEEWANQLYSKKTDEFSALLKK